MHLSTWCLKKPKQTNPQEKKNHAFKNFWNADYPIYKNQLKIIQMQVFIKKTSNKHRISATINVFCPDFGYGTHVIVP